MSKLKYISKYIKYKLFARHLGGLGIHSPFLYDLISYAISDLTSYYAMDDIWEIREKLINSEKRIEVIDFEENTEVYKIKKIKDIVKKSSTNIKFGELLFRLVVYFKPKILIEIGTSIGLGTMYLAKPNSKSIVYTIEGCKKTAEVAKQNFYEMNIENIKPIVGKFDDELNKLLKKIDKLDFVFFDGNNKKENFLKYFNICISKINNETVFVLNDIHSSKEKEKEWKIIKKNKKVKLTVDLFSFGIVFFRKELSKENFVIRF